MHEQDKPMTLVDHLSELRKRIIWVIIFFVITLIIGFSFADELINYFKVANQTDFDWNVFRLTDAVMIYFKFAFLIAMGLTLPFILYQAWRFVAPGLTQKEKKATIWFIPTAFILFIIGIAFAYFIIFPMIVSFLLNISQQMEVTQMFGINEYFSFMFNLIIPFGLFFELPVVVVFLTRIGILKPQFLIRFRKIAYLILAITAAGLTPPDFISQTIVIIPLILIYEFSIWLSKLTAIKRKETMENDSDNNVED